MKKDTKTWTTTWRCNRDWKKVKKSTLLSTATNRETGETRTVPLLKVYSTCPVCDEHAFASHRPFLEYWDIKVRKFIRKWLKI